MERHRVQKNNTLKDSVRVTKKNSGTDTLPFSKILKNVMRERGLTLRQVAEMAGGVRTSVVQSWLSGANPHDLLAIATLADALKISFRSLLVGEPDQHVQVQTFAEMFDETEVFEGICRISIKKLKLRKLGTRE